MELAATSFSLLAPALDDAGVGPVLVGFAVAIAIQNVPEGFAVAAPLVAVGAPRREAVLLALASGAVEPVAAFGAFGLFSSLLPYGLALAAAAMLYVVVDELIPERHARGHERDASVALIVGFAVMMTLDSALG